MTDGWFIDALDVRGGIAFASFRGPDLGDGDLALDVPAFVVAAPDFERRLLASRGTGLAATRGGFQYGLFIGESELRFADPDDLVEFVRRAYLGRGGDDGDTPGGLPRPFGPPSDGGDDAPSDGMTQVAADVNSRMLERLRDAGVHSAGRSADLHKRRDEGAMDGRAYDVPSSPVEFSLRVRLTHAEAELLLMALESVAVELIRRRRINLLLGEGDASAEWRAALRAVGTTARRLHMEGQLLERLAQAVLDPVAARDTGWHLLSEGRASPQIPVRSAAGGRMLASWPIPVSVARQAELPEETATALDLLFRMLADPRRLAKAPSLSLSLVLLAAVMVQPTMPEADGNVDELVGRAGEWLAASLPNRVFPREIEDLIAPPVAPRPDPEGTQHA